MLIDTHCHLDAAEFAEDRDAVARAAATAGVAAMIVPAVAPENFAAVRACCQRHAICHPAYGTHPLYVDSVDETAFDQLRACLDREMAGPHPPVAVGEIGLDFFVPGFDAARQERFFAEQLKIARDFDLPLLLHARRAVDAVLKQLRRIGARGGIAHAFNGSRRQADEFLRLGFRLGFGGAMTFPRAARIRRLASSLPSDAIVLETDAPDIPPAWLAGGRNTPAELARIAAVLAELRGTGRAAVERSTSGNAVSTLRLPAIGGET
ncbi:MAG: TatD family hydrolase [Candidatus Accumulibacter sp.]|jgi:TatD DNase family protein|nr:TatD family hydrolase [Accumulibacter sp.]